MGYNEDIILATKAYLPWEKIQNKNILVTGATGLIGSCIIDILMNLPNQNFNLYALGRNKERADKLFKDYKNNVNFKFIQHDINIPLHQKNDFHYIIAAASGANPIEYSKNPVGVMKTNIIGLDNLFQYGIKHSLEKLVYISSGDVYGEGDGRVFTEEYSGYINPLNPRSCYNTAKRAAESLCVSYSNQFGINVSIARPCHTYGPHFTELDTRVFAQLIKNAVINGELILKSKGDQFRSWSYVVNCSLAILYILFKGENCEAYNIADDDSNITIKELAEIIAQLENIKIKFELPNEIEIKGFNTITKSIFSTDKLKSLGWSSCSNIVENLKSTINEFRDSNNS